MHKKYDWTSDALALIGTMKDVDAAKKLGIHVSTVCKKRIELNIPRFDKYLHQPLGEIPDATIAKAIGIKPSSLSMARRRRQIGPYQKQDKWTGEQIALLGTASDAEVGRAVGRSKMAVYYARRVRGVAAYRVANKAAEHPKNPLAFFN